MATAIFDTLKFIDRLIEAGVSETQARAEVVVIKDALQASNLATNQI